MQNLPKDPIMLLGFVTYDGNANYADRDIDQRELEEKLSGLGYEYSPENNRFW